MEHKLSVTGLLPRAASSKELILRPADVAELKQNIPHVVIDKGQIDVGRTPLHQVLATQVVEIEGCGGAVSTELDVSEVDEQPSGPDVISERPEFAKSPKANPSGLSAAIQVCERIHPADVCTCCLIPETKGLEGPAAHGVVCERLPVPIERLQGVTAEPGRETKFFIQMAVPRNAECRPGELKTPPRIRNQKLLGAREERRDDGLRPLVTALDHAI
jgi:hypothetical protein